MSMMIITIISIIQVFFVVMITLIIIMTSIIQSGYISFSWWWSCDYTAHEDYDQGYHGLCHHDHDHLDHHHINHMIWIIFMMMIILRWSSPPMKASWRPSSSPLQVCCEDKHNQKTSEKGSIKNMISREKKRKTSKSFQVTELRLPVKRGQSSGKAPLIIVHGVHGDLTWVNLRYLSSDDIFEPELSSAFSTQLTHHLRICLLQGFLVPRRRKLYELDLHENYMFAFTECSLATTERSCTSCDADWREPPPSSPSPSPPAGPSSPAAATLRPFMSSGSSRLWIIRVSKLSFRLDEGRATEGQVLAGSPPQVRRSKQAAKDEDR